MDRVKISRWGNSYGIRITKQLMEALNLKENSQLTLEIKNNTIHLTPAAEKLTLDSLLKGVTKDNIHREDFFGKPQGREIW